MEDYIDLKNNTLAYSFDNYNLLPTNENGIKKAIGVPNGIQLEVFDESAGKIKIYAEAINELWYER